MIIIKRNSEEIEFSPEKIKERLKAHNQDLNLDIDKILIECQTRLYDRVHTTEIDNILAGICHNYSTEDLGYDTLGARILISNLHKYLNLKGTYFERAKDYLNPIIIQKYKDYGSPQIDYDSDFNLDYFGAYSYIKEYALKDNNKQILETKAETNLRLSLYLTNSKEEFEEYYKELCKNKISHATPTLVNAGTTDSTMISCTTLTLKGDSRKGIKRTFGAMADHSSGGAGLGLYIGNLRSKETNYSNRGKAAGQVALMRAISEWLNFFKQLETRRGKAAVYTDIWHRDLMSFLEVKNTHSSEVIHDILIGVSIPDLFMERLIEDEEWTLFCPHEILTKTGIKLHETWGKDFEKLYLVLEADKENFNYKTLKASEIMLKIAEVQALSGTPYINFRDNMNNHYNQSNLGVIKNMQLCTEFLGYHDEETEAQCCLGAMPLPNHLKVINDKLTIDFDSLIKSTKLLTKALNNVIDLNKYNTDRAKATGLRDRNIGIGVIGLADVFAQLGIEFESEEAEKLTSLISETIYYSTLSASNELAKSGKYTKEQLKGPNSTPLVNKGQFHFDKYQDIELHYDWEHLRTNIMDYGICNSLFVCYMPTASTSKLLGMNECFEPFDSLIVVRSTSSGNFKMINKHLMKEIQKLGLNQKEVIEDIIKNNGSVQKLDYLTKKIKNTYKTIWEIKQKQLIKLNGLRQVFTDQGISMNVYYKEAKASIITNAMIYAWKNKLKTGVYYTKTLTETKAGTNLSYKAESVTKNPDIECFGCSV